MTLSIIIWFLILFTALVIQWLQIRGTDEGWKSATAASKEEAYYWKGKEGSKFTANQKKAAWKKAGKRCEKCRVRTWFGQPGSRREIIWGLLGVKKAEISNAHHIVPEEFGGEGTKDNLMNLCQPCNIKLGCQITKDSYYVAWKQGRKIYVEA